ncbi:MAG: diaminopropionate ammonia-lyase [Prevotella sp.]|jgi:diaminopropionate ammonia-lyase
MVSEKEITGIRLQKNHCLSQDTDYAAYSYESTANVRKLHETIPGYKPTKLVSLKSFAQRAGIKAMLVKDESTRFGEQAFKPLGGVYAMFRVICEQLHLDYRLTSLNQLLNTQQYREAIGKMTFITTTDGNHGRGVSWASGLFGSHSYVYMPKGTVPVRAENIRRAGNAQVEITDMLYDDCVKFTDKLARRNGWFLIQDTSWPGNELIPSWIMLGYTTMVYEALLQMRAQGYDRPTHVFLQAGVGSMAGAVTAALKATYGDNMPIVATVEPTEVACFYESLKAGDGNPHTSTGNNITIMAGLNCATPCGLAWNLFRDYGRYALSVPDEVTRRGMRLLAHPLGNDPKVVSGESGAVTTGLVEELCLSSSCKDLREELMLDKDAVVLCFSTEGDTDPENYRNITGYHL